GAGARVFAPDVVLPLKPISCFPFFPFPFPPSPFPSKITGVTNPDLVSDRVAIQTLIYYSVESVMGQGSIFYFTLPLQD
ncbi:hypothetical protein ACE1CI_29370, partial [Aerosakkonemataceae cyanobacterium BLCC-F50]